MSGQREEVSFWQALSQRVADLLELAGLGDESLRPELEREIESGCGHAVAGVEAGIDGKCLGLTAEEEAGKHEQHYRERQLRNDESALQTPDAARAAAGGTGEWR